MSVKRYEFYEMDSRNPSHMRECEFGDYVRYDDYNTLMAKAYAAGIAAGELKLKNNALEALCGELEAELKRFKSMVENNDTAQYQAYTRESALKS